ncbi:hypothetical protein SPRG_18969, partial [Saprolegnia parasitica CBS 223.65]
KRFRNGTHFGAVGRQPMRSRPTGARRVLMSTVACRSELPLKPANRRLLAPRSPPAAPLPARILSFSSSN